MSKWIVAVLTPDYLTVVAKADCDTLEQAQAMERKLASRNRRVVLIENFDRDPEQLELPL